MRTATSSRSSARSRTRPRSRPCRSRRTDFRACFLTLIARFGGIYLLELVLATVGASYALLTLAVHTILRGAIPTTISKEGFGWAQEFTTETDESITVLRQQVKSLEADLTTPADQLDLGRAKPS